MKKFMAIYTGSASSRSNWHAMDAETRRERDAAGKQAWGKWVAAHEKAIVDHGSPLGKTKRISTQGISDVKNEIGAYVIVQANSHEEAAQMFENHPHFSIFPGDAVEIMECLPMPDM